MRHKNNILQKAAIAVILVFICVACGKESNKNCESYNRRENIPSVEDSATVTMSGNATFVRGTKRIFIEPYGDDTDR